MVTAKTQYDLKNAEQYFEEHLCVGDHHNESQRVSGEWMGAGAERLGLSGKVRADDFLRLCQNQNPSTGETLTQRLNTTRAAGDKSVANRRIFYDFTFSPPKLVSIAGFLGGDERILEAHARAVRSALREFEAFAATRIRAGGAQNDRMTRNFVSAMFTHDTSRTLDPHLHTHCIVFNATFDSVENRWKALQNYEHLRARKFAENAYYHELARELRAFGYRICNRARGDFQLEGVSEELCERFSKRHTQIDQALTKLLAEKPEMAELGQIANPGAEVVKPEQRVSISEAVQWAEEHLFDRNSVVLECQIWQEALGRARGEGFSCPDLKDFTERRGYIRDADRPGEVTLRDVLLSEWELVQIVKEGVGDCHPLVANPLSANPALDDEQREALDALLCSTNIVSLFRGG